MGEFWQEQLREALAQLKDLRQRHQVAVAEVQRLREAIIAHRDNGSHWVHALTTDEKLWNVVNPPSHQQVEGGCSCGWSGGGSWSEHLDREIVDR